MGHLPDQMLEKQPRSVVGKLYLKNQSERSHSNEEPCAAVLFAKEMTPGPAEAKVYRL